MTYEKMLLENQKLEKRIQELQLQLEQFPDGKLICAQNGKGYKWYHSDGHDPVYLPKKERKLAEQLAHKKYVELQLKNLIHEKNAIAFYMRHHDKNANQAEQDLVTSPAFKDLLAPVFTPLSQELDDWAKASYGKNVKHPESLSLSTISGNLVRSKSEVLIDSVLFKNKIPFRYECILQLDDVYLFPDFTIRHPKTGQVFYWEHFGMMDNPTYRKNACSKLQLYISNGIIPSIQLITTYETKEHPLDLEVIEKNVEHYFL